MKHHVRLAGGAFGPKDVVPVDERARVLRGIVHQIRAGRSPPRKALRRAKPSAGRAKK